MPLIRRRGQRKGRNPGKGNVGGVPVTIAQTSADPPGMNVGNTYQITHVVQGAKGDTLTPTMVYVSSNPSIVTVSASGLVTAIAAGSATVTYYPAGHPTVSDDIDFTVNASPVTPVSVAFSLGSISGQPGQVIPLGFSLLDGSMVSLSGQSPVAATTNGAVATVGSINTSGDPNHVVDITLQGDGTCSIQVGIAGTPNIGSITVTVSTPGGVQPWRVNDFNYADTTAMKADRWNSSTNPNGWWSASSEDKNLNQITLGTGASIPGSATGKYRRYTFPTTEATADYSIEQNVKFPSNVQDVWGSLYARFSANFNLKHPTAPPDEAYKFIFGRVVGVNSRFDITIKTPSAGGKTRATIGHPINQNLVSYYNTGIDDIFDGAWHEWRFHFKTGTQGKVAFWCDGTKIFDSVDFEGHTVDMSGISISGLKLGANMNERPAVSPAMTVDWALIKLYLSDPWGDG